jgi:outer membrane scaffolding protein for murein synthesis (MipA/OmpV family)
LSGYRGVGGGFLEDNPLKDLYIRAALDKSVRLADRVTAGGCALLGAGTSRYNAVRYRSPGEGFADYQASVYVRYALTDVFSVGATLAYTGLVGGDWGLDRRALAPDEIFWGGLNLRAVF